jgi:uncharacterized delta-60 repeat protein
MKQLLVLIVLSILLSTMVMAQAGQLDSNFATNGIFSFSLTTNNGSVNQANAVALQADGKIVLGGQAGNQGGLLRLNTNGTLDKNFGSGGVVTSNFGIDIDQIVGDIAIQPDGKILAAATGLPSGFVVGRFNANGSVDKSFGTNGFASANAAGAHLLALQTDGKILVVGSALARFESNGQLDTSFGSAGLAPLVAPFSSASAIALQSDGKILIASGGFPPAPVINGPPSTGSLARYNTDGSLDKKFGISGQAASVALPSAVAVQSDGKVVVAGTITSKLAVAGNSTGFGLVRYNSNGSIDTSFGTRGGVVTGFPSTNLTGAFALAIQSNGDIVAAGESGNVINFTQLSESFALVRYLNSGHLDTTFGSGGLVTTNFGNNAVAFVTALAVQNDGKIVAVGSNGGGSIEAARYLGN